MYELHTHDTAGILDYEMLALRHMICLVTKKGICLLYAPPYPHFCPLTPFLPMSMISLIPFLHLSLSSLQTLALRQQPPLTTAS